jgi:predicted acetyltransferase
VGANEETFRFSGYPRPVLTFRTAAPADLDRLIEIHSSAYPDPRGHEERRKKFVANPRGDLGTLHVAEDGGEIVAHAFLFPLRAWFARGVVPIGGIASVAVAPEARGRGVAGALLSHLHQRADAARAAITMLYPFRQGYYAKHGYAAVTPNRRLAFHPGSIPSAWRNEPEIAIRTVQIDLASPVADRTLIVNAYARAAARTHGWVARPPALWDHFFANERRVWLLATRGRRAAGYVCWSLAQTEPYAAIRLAVHELVADDAAARRVLLGAIGAQRDQVAEVEMEVAADDPIDRALVDADRGRFGSPEVEHPLGVLSGGPMVRLVDVSRGLAARTYAADGEIDVAIDRAAEGEHQASSSPALRVAIAGGKAKLSVPSKPARAPLTIDRAALAAVLFGGLSASNAARLGWARGEDATLERADALFASSPFFALDAY